MHVLQRILGIGACYIRQAVARQIKIAQHVETELLALVWKERR